MQGRKQSLKWQLARLLDLVAQYDCFDRPVFILAPPRSGSTFLFDILSQFDKLTYLQSEADDIWWRNFPYERMQEPSDYVGSVQATRRAMRAIRRETFQRTVSVQHSNRAWPIRYLHSLSPTYMFGLKRVRYLDKTIANCFHLEFLDRAFPDARYIFLVRDPRANISSMIEGWPYVERFGKPQLTAIVQSVESRTIDHWTYPAPPGWQEVLSEPLPQICAWSWRQHVEHVLAFLERQPREASWVRYEELVAHTPTVVRRLSEALDLQWSRQAEQYVNASPLSRTTVTEPAGDKWKRTNYEEIISILPYVTETAARIGYDLQPSESAV